MKAIYKKMIYLNEVEKLLCLIILQYFFFYFRVSINAKYKLENITLRYYSEITNKHTSNFKS